jgi:molybdate transport system regulatory protein
MTAIKLRILFDGAMIGPGKAQLLDHIRETGSIAAAGRQMGMSYKRAWMLAEEMNSAFAQPLVASVRGGPGGGGARLTEAGSRCCGCIATPWPGPSRRRQGRSPRWSGC